jgi:hypothetical protein
VEVGRDNAAAKSKVNALVTGSHILFTLAYSVSQLMIIFSKNPTQNQRILLALISEIIKVSVK